MQQKERIIEYMRRFGTITPYDAFRDLGITKLSTRIGEMKRNGVNIEQKWNEGRNRYGEKVKYMVYWLGEESK